MAKKFFRFKKPSYICINKNKETMKTLNYTEQVKLSTQIEIFNSLEGLKEDARERRDFFKNRNEIDKAQSLHAVSVELAKQQMRVKRNICDDIQILETQFTYHLENGGLAMI